MKCICRKLQDRSKSCAASSRLGKFKSLMASFLKLFILLNYLFLMYFIFSILYCLLKRYLCSRAQSIQNDDCDAQTAQSKYIPRSRAQSTGNDECDAESDEAECVPERRRQRTVACQGSLNSIKKFIHQNLCGDSLAEAKGNPAVCKNSSRVMSSPIALRAVDCCDDRPRRFEFGCPRVGRLFETARQRFCGYLSPQCPDALKPSTSQSNHRCRPARKVDSYSNICKLMNRLGSCDKISRLKRKQNNCRPVKRQESCEKTPRPTRRQDSCEKIPRPARRQDSCENMCRPMVMRRDSCSKLVGRAGSYSKCRRPAQIRESHPSLFSLPRGPSTPRRCSRKKRLVYISPERCVNRHSSSSLENIRVEFNVVHRPLPPDPTLPPGCRDKRRCSMSRKHKKRC